MAKNVLLCLSHSVEEFDQLRLLHGLGYGVCSFGGYIDPAHPHDPKRPPLPDIPCIESIKEAVDAQGTDDNLGMAQAWLPDAALEWADVVIFHHYLARCFGQWGRLKEWGGRIVWRTVGQSVEGNEMQAKPYHGDGLEIVRYSPQEQNIPGYAGEDAMIRFYKDPAEWSGWTGENAVVTNVTQKLKQRHPYTNFAYWELATAGLPTMPMGEGSEELPGGTGPLPYDDMRQGLRDSRVYLYTGTQPASYTLGLIEALMVGIPTVSIGPSWMDAFPYGPSLFEGHKIAAFASDSPIQAKAVLATILAGDDEHVSLISKEQRQFAIDNFGIEAVGTAWLDFLE